MKIDFRKMMAEGVEWYDPELQAYVVKGDVPKDSQQYYSFVDKKTRIRMVYTASPASFVIRSCRYLDGNNVVRGKDTFRAMVNRFLEVFPSSLVHVRMSALREFVSELKYAVNSDTMLFNVQDFKSYCSSFEQRYDEITGGYPYSRKPKTLTFRPHAFRQYTSHTTYIRREDRFTARYRMYQRTRKGNSHIDWKLDSFINTWHQSCGSLGRNGAPQHSSSKEGWTYDWHKKEIKTYNHSGLVVKQISLDKINLSDHNVIPVYGINNCFCGVIEDVIGETYVVRLLNRNLNFYGYICTDSLRSITDNSVAKRPASIVKGQEPARVYLRARIKCDDLIATTKAKALAIMLATS